MKMEFGDFVFPSNPSKLEIVLSSNINSNPVMGENSKTENVSVNPVIVKGSGDFYAAEGGNYCTYLQHLLRTKKSSPLLVPSGLGINAFLTEFSYGKNKDRGSYSYSFVFTEDCGRKKEIREFCRTAAKDGENAFDITKRCGVSLNDIMRLNDIKTPFDIKSGDTVVIR